MGGEWPQQLSVQPLYIKVVAQRHSNDCVICCLAMLFGMSYEAVAIATSKVRPDTGTPGLYWTDARKIAALLGRSFKRTRRTADPDNLVGMLAVMHERSTRQHAVVLCRGVIIDPAEPSVWDDVDTYLEANEFRIGSVLVPA